MKLIILANPRSGSNILTTVLGEYVMRKDWGYKGVLHEALGLNKKWRIRHNKILECYKVELPKIFSEIDYVREYDRNWNMIKYQLQKENYLIKLFPRHLTAEVFQYFNTTYNFIFLTRKDKLRQILSYYIASQTHWHYYGDAERRKYKYETINRQQFDNIKFMMNEHKHWCSLIPPTSIFAKITYEQINALDDKMKILDLLGFDDWDNIIGSDSILPKFPVKHDYSITTKGKLATNDILNLFFNKEEILKWTL